jgi:two-component system chemotaxis response regulator CheY
MKLCLIVDDSKVIRKISRSVMEDLGFFCDESENGQEALDLCNTAMPEVIILDWNMPVMNGLEFLQALRKVRNGNYPQVIFCTTENSVEFIQKGIAVGANEYIIKPFSKEVMVSKLSQLGLIEEVEQ